MVFGNYEKGLLILLGDSLDFIEIEPTSAVGLCLFGITDLVNTQIWITHIPLYADRQRTQYSKGKFTAKFNHCAISHHCPCYAPPPLY